MVLCYTIFPFSQLVNSGEDVLVFYNDRASFQTLVQMMRSERDRMDENSPLIYHIHLVELLAICTEGKNVYTEIKCNSLLPLDDIVRVVTHEDCIPEVRSAIGDHVNFGKTQLSFSMGNRTCYETSV